MNPTISTPQAGGPQPNVQTNHIGMWVAFEYIILFISMYMSFTALGGILNTAVDKYFPPPTDSVSGIYSSVASYMIPGYMAAIIVTYPIFVILFLHINKQILKNPAILNLRSRKIMIYITLIVTFLYMISQLIATLYSFFQGTSTIATGFHLGVSLLVAGSVFVYLLLNIKGDRKENA